MSRTLDDDYEPGTCVAHLLSIGSKVTVTYKRRTTHGWEDITKDEYLAYWHQETWREYLEEMAE